MYGATVVCAVYLCVYPMAYPKTIGDRYQPPATLQGQACVDGWMDGWMLGRITFIVFAIFATFQVFRFSDPKTKVFLNIVSVQTRRQLLASLDILPKKIYISLIIYSH